LLPTAAPNAFATSLAPMDAARNMHCARAAAAATSEGAWRRERAAGSRHSQRARTMTTERAATQLQGCIATVPTSGVGVDMSAARGGEADVRAEGPAGSSLRSGIPSGCRASRHGD
jgi:hypothetical protein